MADQNAAPTSAADSALLTTLREGYSFTEPSITLGAAITEDTVHADVPVRLPLGMMNRHGLVAGATGTGKTVHCR